MRNKMIFAGVAGALVMAMPVQAKQPVRHKPTKAELTEAQQTLSLMVSALNSKTIPQETKNGLFGCLYENSLHKIAQGAQMVLNKHKDINAKDPNERLLVLAGVCGAPVPRPAKKGK